jgi:uncharacterized SAM-binding protein YcdF (DUF218 family)
VPLVVLGCRPVWAGDGRLQGALRRRVEAAREGLGGRQGWFVVSGGRTWHGVVEADAMADDLVRGGVPRGDIVRERCSMTTHDNARFSAELLRRLGVGRVTLVTCEWHMTRAARLFRREGLEVEPLPAKGPRVTSWVRWYRSGHEWVSARLQPSGGTRG